MRRYLDTHAMKAEGGTIGGERGTAREGMEAISRQGIGLKQSGIPMGKNVILKPIIFNVNLKIN